MVEAAAMRPISLVPAPRYLANRGRVGDLDIVELKMAVAPMRERSKNLVVHLPKYTPPIKAF